MIPFLEIAADAAGDGASGVLIHVEITPLPIAVAPIDDLAGTGAGLPVLLIVAAAALIVFGVALVIRERRARERTRFSSASAS